jgi:hypothetical protein
LNRASVYTVETTNQWDAAERGDTMTTVLGMLAMTPVLFASAGYVLVSSRGTAEIKETQRR